MSVACVCVGEMLAVKVGCLFLRVGDRLGLINDFDLDYSAK